MQKVMFEGSEKKLEIVFSSTTEPLRNKPASFWSNLCDKAKTQIVLRFSNSFCDSYVLSESSLFVWDHRLLMLTCGNTFLIDAMFFLLKQFKKSDIDLLFYQRKNEILPYMQKSSFIEDLKKINKKTTGKAYCFGVPDNHHFYLFCLEGASTPPTDCTVEILMYDLEDYVKEFFLKATSAAEIRKQLCLDTIFPNAQIEDHMFTPVGYSLNALIGENKYYTIHVTPQDPGFYVSFETNIETESINQITEKILSIFKPHSFDVIVFSPTIKNTSSFEYIPNAFIRSAYFTKRLQCGYIVSFSSFCTPATHYRQAFELCTKS